MYTAQSVAREQAAHMIELLLVGDGADMPTPLRDVRGGAISPSALSAPRAYAVGSILLILIAFYPWYGYRTWWRYVCGLYLCGRKGHYSTCRIILSVEYGYTGPIAQSWLWLRVRQM